MKTFRVSTENGDTYTFQAKDINEARQIAREAHQGERFTVYEDNRR